MAIINPVYLTLFLFFLVSKPAFAGNDLTIICDKSGCSKLPKLSFFNETNIYPGFTTSQKISITNNLNSTCYLTFKTISKSKKSDILSQKILINISSIDSVTDYKSANYILSDLFNSSESIGYIQKGHTNKYLWSMVFDSDADNSYQNLTSTFDIDFNFECDDEQLTAQPDYQQQVLGATTENNLTEKPEVLGVQDSSRNKQWLPILFIVVLFINLFYIRFFI